MAVKDTFKKIINHKSETVLEAGLLMSLLTFLGSILGLVRNALLASSFGASQALDIYYASFRLPDLIYNIFILGAISAAFIPLFNDYLAREKEKSWQFVSLILVLIGLFLIIFGFIISIFADSILAKLLVGFDEASVAQAVVLTRIMMIQPFLLGISSVVAGILRSFRLFFVTSLSPLLYNFGIILGVIFLVPRLGLKGLAYGVVLGAFFHLVVQLPTLWQLGYRGQKFHFADFKRNFQKLVVIMSSRASSIIISQLFLVGITAISTLLKAGTLAIINLVDSFLPYTTVALPFADAAFPQLSKLEAENQSEEFFQVFFTTLSQILFFIIPLTCWIIVFREPIVRLLLGYGKFDWTATNTTIKILAILALGMIFQSINYYFLKVFFAKKDARRPFWASLIAYSIGLVSCYQLAIKFGSSGLALGILCTYCLYSLILFFFLKKYLDFSQPSLKKFQSELFKIIIISLISSLIGGIVLSLLSQVLPFKKVIYLACDTLIAGLLTLSIFLGLGRYLKLEELLVLKDVIFKKIHGTKTREHS
ncbi:MAG: Murein biosynthesis integral rane protein MurJ [Patescibacteria group bacterium]|nr:Murein biosynthesis integral rane protein MurJ [Patescibacteria group bacterium]